MAVAHKNTVVTLVERGGIARSFHVDTARIGTVMPIVRANIAKESALMTDEAQIYATRARTSPLTMSSSFQGRIRSLRRRKDGPHQHRRTSSIFKRGMKGVYQHCGEHHLHRYLAEFDFRYSNRIALGVDDGARAFIALKGANRQKIALSGDDSRRRILGNKRRLAWLRPTNSRPILLWD